MVSYPVETKPSTWCVTLLINTVVAQAAVIRPDQIDGVESLLAAIVRLALDREVNDVVRNPS